MFTFCDVLHETKQKNINKLVRVRNTDWKSSLSQGKKILFISLVHWASNIQSLVVQKLNSLVRKQYYYQSE